MSWASNLGLSDSRVLFFTARLPCRIDKPEESLVCRNAGIDQGRTKGILGKVKSAKEKIFHSIVLDTWLFAGKKI